MGFDFVFVLIFLLVRCGNLIRWFLRRFLILIFFEFIYKDCRIGVDIVVFVMC